MAILCVSELLKINHLVRHLKAQDFENVRMPVPTLRGTNEIVIDKIQDELKHFVDSRSAESTEDSKINSAKVNPFTVARNSEIAGDRILAVLCQLLFCKFVIMKEGPTLFAFTYALGLILMLLCDAPATWRAVIWRKGENLFPEKLSALQAIAVDIIPQVQGLVSMLPLEFHLLPLPGMTFDQWLLAKLAACAFSLLLVVWCYWAASPQDNKATSEATAAKRAKQSPKRKVSPSVQSEANAKPEASWVYSETDFLHACLYGLANRVRAILKNPDFNIGCVAGLTKNTGLHLACTKSHLPVVQMFLARAERIAICLNAKNTDKKTPLMLAVESSSAVIVDKLVKSNKIDLDGDRGMLPLTTAIKNDDTEIAEMIFTAMTKRKIQFKDRMEIYIRRLLALTKELSTKSLPSAKEASHRNDMRVYKEQIAQAALTSLKDDKCHSEVSPEDQWKVDIEEMCECIICNEPYSSEIFACENDHWLCGDCKTKNAVMVRNCCPLCNVDFGRKPPRRCFGVERMILLVQQRLSRMHSSSV